MTPTDVLRAEHRLIERGLEVLEALAGRVARNMSLAPEPPRQVYEFFIAFADGFHHAKEEQFLFPALRKHAHSAESAAITVMLDEHEDGRAYMKELGEVIAAGVTSDDSRERFVVAARAYAELQRHHVVKEEKDLLPMAGRALPPEAVADLDRRFSKHDADNAAVRAHWERVIDQLTAELFRTPRSAVGR